MSQKHFDPDREYHVNHGDESLESLGFKELRFSWEAYSQTPGSRRVLSSSGHSSKNQKTSSTRRSSDATSRSEPVLRAVIPVTGHFESQILNAWTSANDNNNNNNDEERAAVNNGLANSSKYASNSQSLSVTSTDYGMDLIRTVLQTRSTTGSSLANGSSTSLSHDRRVAAAAGTGTQPPLAAISLSKSNNKVIPHYLSPRKPPRFVPSPQKSTLGLKTRMSDNGRPLHAEPLRSTVELKEAAAKEASQALKERAHIKKVISLGIKSRIMRNGVEYVYDRDGILKPLEEVERLRQEEEDAAKNNVVEVKPPEVTFSGEILTRTEIYVANVIKMKIPPPERKKWAPVCLPSSTYPLSDDAQVLPMGAVRRWPHYDKLQEGEVCVTIEHCCDCWEHMDYGRHDESKYEQIAQSVKNQLDGILTAANIPNWNSDNIHIIPINQSGNLSDPIKTQEAASILATTGAPKPTKFRPFLAKANVDDGSTEQQRFVILGVDTRIRVGALEVQLAVKKNRKLTCHILHSKLFRGSWPRLDTVAITCNRILQEVGLFEGPHNSSATRQGDKEPPPTVTVVIEDNGDSASTRDSTNLPLEPPVPSVPSVPSVSSAPPAPSLPPASVHVIDPQPQISQIPQENQRQDTSEAELGNSISVNRKVSFRSQDVSMTATTSSTNINITRNESIVKEQIAPNPSIDSDSISASANIAKNESNVKELIAPLASINSDSRSSSANITRIESIVKEPIAPLASIHSDNSSAFAAPNKIVEKRVSIVDMIKSGSLGLEDSASQEDDGDDDGDDFDQFYPMEDDLPSRSASTDP